MKMADPKFFDERIYTKSENCQFVKMDEFYLCSTGNNNLVFKVNETAGSILKLLNGKLVSQHQIILHIKENFNCNSNDEQIVEKDISDILNEFERYGLIVASAK